MTIKGTSQTPRSHSRWSMRAIQLAAAPAFAIMALVTLVVDTGTLCSSAPDASPIGGMPFMYALMAVFHTAPWVSLWQQFEGPQIRGLSASWHSSKRDP